MKRALLLVILILVSLIAFSLLKKKSNQSNSTTSRLAEAALSHTNESAASSSPTSSTRNRRQVSLGTNEEEEFIEFDIFPAQEFGKSGNDEAEDIDHIISLISFYDAKLREGGIPTGMNEDFVDALTGKNSRRMRFIKRSHSRIDDQGRFIDQWNNPYFFHSISSKELTIRSAGPDQELHTEDDIILSNR